MTEAQKVAVVVVRLVAVGIMAYGFLGFLGIGALSSGVAFFGPGGMQMGSMPGVAGMAAVAALLTIALGLGLFFLAKPLSRLVSFDL